MKRAFLDLGGHCGESVQKFLPDYPEHDFYSFEPNLDLAHIIIRVLGSTGRTTFLYPGAAWTHDGTLDFFIGHDQGSTAVSGKVELDPAIPQVDYTQPKQVSCIDISSWILRNFQRGDDVIIKMDVEGAEYEILPKMLKDSSIDLISVLYCEWHYDRFPGVTYEQHKELMESVSKRTKLMEWF